MNTVTVPRWTSRDTLGVFLREAAYQFRTVLRRPGFVLPTVLFPTMFYVFFGLVFGKSGGGHMATFMLATYGTFGVMAPALFGFGVGVAMERERGILAMKRVAPMPPMAYLFAKAAMAMLFALVIVLLLFALGAIFGGVRLPPGQWITLGLALVLGALPFCALGLVVGVRVNGQASAAIVNLIYLPMSFLGGLWVPLQLMPHWLQGIAVALPTYHLSQLALGIIHTDSRGSLAVHLAYLAVFTVACLAVSVRGWRRITDR
ncbi:MAG TPA: ABC transporter permease [Rhodanobacteraceae bacterium]|nr:ABC transporter permease [Rhodanobacteraceae bacterium]